jgi:hypothetical protein
MKTINARSPYFISITGSTNTTLQLFLWNGSTEPASHTYSFTKSAPSSTQTESNYDIAPYLREYIENITPSYEPTPATESSTSFVNFKTIAFSNGTNRTSAFKTRVIADSGTYEADNCLGEFMGDYVIGVGVDGYNNYMGGYNQASSSNIVPLADTSKLITYLNNTDKMYVNVIINHTGTNITADYVTSVGTTTLTVLPSTATKRTYNMKVPLKLVGFTSSSILRIKSNGTTLYTYNIAPVCETKYTPVLCQFINRYGGWQFLTFFKAQASSISVEKSKLNLIPDYVNYNASRGQVKSFNINGSQKILLNTGFVDQNYSDLIQDLLLSNTVLLDGLPVQVMTTQNDIKTSLKDKNINYQIEFEYAYNLINNVI